MKTNKIALACSKCGSRNYVVKANPQYRTERLEIKKYCKYCNEHTLHKETK
ncbi:50S ribosomal protein L33 [Aerococcus kribbianus]|uniref:Large ribosomal subunit protein bL33 n=1 Tax=Aerococcus kribbianus TaxID=2999064 RepID=A0A9X3JDX1_9LACT|nr:MULTISPECIES: 50S ribosomal protein L33 [unclassified Aerococcus]MCZ0717951.1 50S ribosomal protein L33 [Aerococcus sp. YH-aer221]MCZ0726238.1 50S ribosomal protein L33 [Aerococcus sp. YH-aer222]